MEMPALNTPKQTDCRYRQIIHLLFSIFHPYPKTDKMGQEAIEYRSLAHFFFGSGYYYNFVVFCFLYSAGAIFIISEKAAANLL